MSLGHGLRDRMSVLYFRVRSADCVPHDQGGSVVDRAIVAKRSATPRRAGAT